MKQIQFEYVGKREFSKKLDEIAELCLSLNSDKLLFHIYSSVDSLENSVGELDDIREILDKKLPGADYVGCTTNSNILDGRQSDADTIIVCTIFEDPTTIIKTYQLDLTGKTVDDLIRFTENTRDGMPWMRAIEMLVSSKAMLEGNLTSLFDRVSTRSVMFGGGAFSKEAFAKGGDAASFVFSKGEDYNFNAMTFTFLGGENLHFKTVSVSGWTPLGASHTITSAEGNVLKTLNGKPAFEIYSKYLNIKNDKFFGSNTIEFPLMCRTSSGYEVLRDPTACTRDGEVVLVSEVDVFESVRLAYGDRRSILKSIRRAAEQIREFAPDAISVFSCVARSSFWGDEIDQETELFPYIAPTFGFYTSGEIMSEGGNIHHFNETMVIACIREGDIDTQKALPMIPPEETTRKVSLMGRLANFISVATAELEQNNSDLDRLLRAVEENRKVADEANRAKSDFLANMSHEIRTPINAILGFDTMILRECRDDAINKYAMDIHRAGANLLSIINDILDLSKIESGKMEIVPVEYELTAMLTDVMDMMSLKGNEKGLDVRLEAERNLPSLLYGDDVRIRQVIVNLMNNAVKYTEKGSVTLSVSGTRKGEYETLHISVSDTGIGIKPEDMDRLFEKFRRIEEARNHRVEGSGLGMNITVELLALMDSHLSVSSRYGQGSVFSFDLTQKILRNDPIGEFDYRSERLSNTEEYSSLFYAPDAEVLIVDDNEMNRKVIRALLKLTGIHFDEADGGIKCIDMTEKKHYDLILLDHMMPDLDGIRTLHRIKGSPVNMNVETPVIVMTANAITGAMEEYIWEGFDAYISKPVNPDKLESLLCTYLPADKVKVMNMTAENKEQLANDGSFLQVEGMDIRIALQNLPSEELVLKTAVMFVEGAKHEADNLERLYNMIRFCETEEVPEKVLSEYRTSVHAMKSASATIGAMTASGLARYLEYASRDGNRAKVETVTPAFLEEWRSFASRLKEALGNAEKNGMISPEGRQAEEDTATPEELAELLRDMNAAVQDMDIDTADELMAAIKDKSEGLIAREELSNLTGAVMNIDIVMVEKLTDELISMLRG